MLSFHTHAAILYLACQHGLSLISTMFTGFAMKMLNAGTGISPAVVFTACDGIQLHKTDTMRGKMPH